MRAFALIHMVGGAPDIGLLTLHGYCLGASAGDWGMYLIAGTVPQLIAVDALPNDQVVGICTFDNIDDVVSVAKRTEIDAWADDNFPSLPSVPPSWTYREIIIELYTRANEHYDYDKFYLCDTP